MDDATIAELLNTTTTAGSGTSLFDMNALLQAMAPFFLLLSIVSVLIMVLYIISIVSKWRANKAIMDIKKLLIEMNERDKARHDIPTATPPLEAPASPAPIGTNEAKTPSVQA